MRQHNHVAALHAGDGVAVRRRFGNVVQAEHPARARPVLHDDLLAEALGHLRRDEARHDVGGVPRRERDDDADRLARIGLRAGTRAREQQKNSNAKSFHVSSYFSGMIGSSR
jgi:hypothetical protein